MGTVSVIRIPFYVCPRIPKINFTQLHNEHQTVPLKCLAETLRGFGRLSARTAVARKAAGDEFSQGAEKRFFSGRIGRSGAGEWGARPQARGPSVVASDGLPPLPARGGSAPVVRINHLVKRTETVVNRVRAAVSRESELAEKVSCLAQRLSELVEKNSHTDAELERLLEIDTKRSELAKQKHEELDREFNEFKNWNVLDRKSWIVSVVDKVGIFIVSALSFLLFLPFTALYSKLLRFYRNRQRRGLQTVHRPPWITGGGKLARSFSAQLLEGTTSNSWGLGQRPYLSSGQLDRMVWGRDEAKANYREAMTEVSPKRFTQKSGDFVKVEDTGPSDLYPENDSKSAGGSENDRKVDKGPRKRRTSSTGSLSASSTREEPNPLLERSAVVADGGGPSAKHIEKADGDEKRREDILQRKPSWTLDVNQEEGFEIEIDNSGDFWGAFGTPAASSSAKKGH